MGRKILLLFCFAFLLTLNACSVIPFKGKPDFIKTNRTRFQQGDKPYYFVGTNFWYGCYIGSDGETGDRQRLLRELDRLQAMGVTNLRILAASEESQIKNSLTPAIQKKPGVYDEKLLEGLDFLLTEMGKRDMRAVVFLNNFWEWSGGMSQYNSWATNDEVLDPEDPQVGWDSFMNSSASFYKNEKANELFRKFIYTVITRKNSFSGLAYIEDPTIMAWQLANEPRPGSGEYAVINADVFYRWIDATAQYIHSIDQNHLVTTGNEGVMGSSNSEIYMTAHKSRYIDYMTFHLWPKNWGWFDAKKIDETYAPTVEKAADYIKQHIEFARKLNKPVTMEEFGLSRDNELVDSKSPTTARDKYYDTILKIVYDSASAGSPIAGSNFWAWGGEGRGKNADGKWRKGDPFVGDPGQEPQGFNSVFDTDSSTINVILRYAKLMQELSEKKELNSPVKDQISSK